MFAQAKAEVGEPSHSDSPLADMRHRSASKVFPFQFSPTPTRPLESTRGEKPLELSSPYLQNFWFLPFFFNFFKTILDRINLLTVPI
jgi:hypothetical protein